MSVPTAPECIDQAASLIRAATAARSEDDRIRLFKGAETWLQMAKQQLLDSKETSKPEPLQP